MTKTMKRIEHYVKGKGVLESKFAFREAKINRTLEALIDSAKESALESEAKADETLERLGEAADNSDAIARVFNDYIELQATARDYRESAEILEGLRTKLQEEVNVEPNGIEVEVVNE